MEKKLDISKRFVQGKGYFYEMEQIGFCAVLL